jgi:hypothetical protein
VDLRSDDPYSSKGEEKETAGHLQKLDGGAMAGIGPNSPEFINTVIQSITEQKETLGSKRE